MWVKHAISGLVRSRNHVCRNCDISWGNASPWDREIARGGYKGHPAWWVQYKTK